MKKGILLFVMLLLSVQQLSPVYSSDLTDDYFDIATNYFNSSDNDKAIEYLDSILKIEPDNLKAKTLKNKILPPKENKENIDSKITTSSNNIKPPENFTILDAPDVDLTKLACNSQYYIAKGVEFYNKCEFDVAVEYFFRAISVDRFNAVAYNDLALAYEGKNAPGLAIKYFKKSNSINRAYTQPLVNLAMLYKKLGQDEKTIFYLKKAMCFNNKDYMAYNNLAEFYQCKTDYSNAIQNYKSAVKINPKFANSYLNLAICFIETEDFNYALMVLNQYLELKPDSDYAYFLLAKAYLGLSQFDNARSAINKALSINNNGDYIFELAKIEYYQCDYKSAIDNLNSILKTGSASAEIFNYIGLCNYKLQNYDIAIANFKKAVLIDSLRPIYYYNLAMCYKAFGDEKSFATYLNISTKINPINYQDFMDLSSIYLINGNTSSALCVLNNAILKYPNYKPLYLAKSKIYEANNDTLHYNETMKFIGKRFN